MIGITRKQRQLYDFIASYFARHGYAPNYDEMAEAIQRASKGGIGEILRALEERGYINRLRNRARAIELVHPAPTVTLNSEICTLTDRYAAEHRISRDTAANELLRIAFGAAA